MQEGLNKVLSLSIHQLSSYSHPHSLWSADLVCSSGNKVDWFFVAICITIVSGEDNAPTQEPINRSLCLSYSALESTLSRVDLFLERLSGEVFHTHILKTQSKQSYVSGIVLRQTSARWAAKSDGQKMADSEEGLDDLSDESSDTVDVSSQHIL